VVEVNEHTSGAQQRAADARKHTRGHLSSLHRVIAILELGMGSRFRVAFGRTPRELEGEAGDE
jgi:hypothetical protein